VHDSSAQRLKLRLPRPSTLASAAEALSLFADHGSRFPPYISASLVYSFASAFAFGPSRSPIQANSDFRTNKTSAVIAAWSSTGKNLTNPVAEIDAVSVHELRVPFHAR
jgi:hypothetical protein